MKKLPININKLNILIILTLLLADEIVGADGDGDDEAIVGDGVAVVVTGALLPTNMTPHMPPFRQ
jgi:hypothetical protein